MSESGMCCSGGGGLLEKFAWFIGETARPMSLAIIATSTAWGFLNRLGVAELGIMSGLVGTLYAAKAWERREQAKAEAEVKKAGG